jgi:hypothetical protein
MFVLFELARSLLSRYLDRYNLRLEVTGSLRAAEPLLRTQRPVVLCLAGKLEFLHEMFGVPAGISVGKGVVQVIAQHAVVELAVAQPVAPPPPRDEVKRLIHVLHAARKTSILPSAISCAADTMACAPEPQTRLTVSGGVVTGSPAWTAA